MKVRNRIKKTDEFQDVIKHGRALRAKAATLFLKDGLTDQLRVGISVPTKLGGAVIRNKVKRQIRMIVVEQADLSVPRDVVIIARLAYDHSAYQTMKTCLTELFEKAGIRK